MRRMRWGIVVLAGVLISLAVLLLLVALYPASFGISTSDLHYGYLPFFGFFFILIVAFFIIRVAFWGARMSRYGQRGGGGGNYGMQRPAAIARLRYARGEISREQYEQIVQDLGRGPRTP